MKRSAAARLTVFRQWFQLLVVLGLLGTGCPRVEPEGSGTQAEPSERPPLPVFVRDFGSIQPAHHNYLSSPPADGLPREELETIFEHVNTQQTRTLWGTQRVLEFSDINAAHPSLSPVGAWVLGPTRSSGVETVDAVLFAGFHTAPSASGFEELLLGLPTGWPRSWDLCRPARTSTPNGPARLIAHDPATGAKLGLLESDEAGGVRWTIDHVGFLSTRLEIAAWWAEKGYGLCVPLGSMTADGEFLAAED